LSNVNNILSHVYNYPPYTLGLYRTKIVDTHCFLLL